MADSPEGSVEISDDELDNLVNEVEADAAPESTDDPETQSTDPATADESDEDDGPASSGAGDEDEDEQDDSHAAPAAQVAAAPAGKPFQFKASGSTHELPGARELADGSIVVPPTAKAQLLQRLASQVELSSNFRTLQRDTSRQIARLKAERTDKDIEAEAVIKLMSDIAGMTPEQRFDYFDDFDKQIPALQLDIQRQQLERDRKALAEERNPTPLPEEAQEQRQGQLDAALRGTYARVMAHPDIKLLNVEDVNRVFQKHAARADRLVVKDKDGEAFDDTEVIDDINLLLDIRKRQPTTARTQNAVRNADKNAIPPVVRGTVPTGNAKGKGQQSYAGKQADFKRDFLKGDLDT
jgi:hypothetical protein